MSFQKCDKVISATCRCIHNMMLPLKVLVVTIDAQWEGMGDVGLVRYEPALLPPCLTIRVFSELTSVVGKIFSACTDTCTCVTAHCILLPV